MRLLFSKSETIELLELYYREIENADVTVNISAKSAHLGYGMAEYDGCLVTIKVKGTMSLLVKELSFEKELSNKEVTSSVEMNSGNKSITEGYGMGERTVSRAYFNGIIIEAEKKLEKVR